MGRRGKLNFTSLFFFKPSINGGGGGGGGGGDTTPSSSSSSSSSLSTSSWAWPSCKQAPRTDSFRSGPAAVPTRNVMFKTVNSVYFDSADASPSSSSSDGGGGSISDDVESEEAVIRGLVRSDRLLFEPGCNKSPSILTSTQKDGEGEAVALALALKESVAMAVDSSDPYGDFRRSMEEMVAAHGTVAGSWECLEELLVWYLRLNGKKNHGLIVAAFVDLLLNLAAAASSAAATDHSNEINRDEIKDVVLDGRDHVVASSSTSISSISTSNSNSNSPTSSSVSFEIQEEGSGSC